DRPDVFGGRAAVGLRHEAARVRELPEARSVGANDEQLVAVAIRPERIAARVEEQCPGRWRRSGSKLSKEPPGPYARLLVCDSQIRPLAASQATPRGPF